MSNLPQDILTIILSKLPVKSLLRFRCVSKSCCSLISDSEFAKLHLTQSIQNNEPNLMLWNIFKTYFITHIAPSLEAIKINTPITSPDSLRISSSCNGLLCLHTDDLDVIWNPSTKQFKELPSPPFLHGFLNFEIGVFHGFGCDSSTNEYKLVKIVQCLDIHADEYFSEVGVYSLGTDSWHPIEDMGSYNLIDDIAEFVNGTCNWVAKRSSDNSDGELIISFDIKDEKFRVVPHPDSVKCISCLGVLGGNLCLLEQFDGLRATDVWLRKDCEAEEEWTKLFTIILDGFDLFKFSRVLCFTNNGKVLLATYKKCFVLYDPGLNEVQVLHTSGTLEERLRVMPYVESLMSLKTNN